MTTVVKRNTRKTPFLSVTASNINPTLTGLGLNPGFRGNKAVIYSYLYDKESGPILTSQTTQ